MHFINPFSIIIGIGASVGLWRVYDRLVPAQRIKGLSTAIWALCGGLLGARLGYVIFHLQYYSLHRGEILKFWAGGVGDFGVLAGAVIFTILAALIFRSGVFRTLDLVAVMLLPVAVAGWLGCWSVGAAYGQALEPGTWWGILALDETGVTSLRVPLQPAAAASLIIFLLLAERLTRQRTQGLFFAANCLIFSLHTLLFSLMRADPMQILWGLRLDTLFWIFSSTAFAVVLVILLQRKSKTDKMNRDDLQLEVDA